MPADGVELDLAAIGAPASLQALVAARLDALTAAGEAGRHRRQRARRDVHPRRAGGARRSRPGRLDPVLGSLTRKEILAVQSDRFSAERGQFRFVQSVVRQVAYATLSRRDRKARHLAAADHLVALTDRGDDLAVIIAQHLLDAVDASSATDPDVPEITGRACDYLERAAIRARSVGAPAEALRLLESALEHTTEPADRARLQLAAARAANDAGDHPAARRHATESAAVFDHLDRPVDAASCGRGAGHGPARDGRHRGGVRGGRAAQPRPRRRPRRRAGATRPADGAVAGDLPQRRLGRPGRATPNG